MDYFFGIEEKEWEAAENDCVTRGGHLTSIFSREENDFLFQQIQQIWCVCEFILIAKEANMTTYPS